MRFYFVTVAAHASAFNENSTRSFFILKPPPSGFKIFRAFLKVESSQGTKTEPLPTHADLDFLICTAISRRLCRRQIHSEGTGTLTSSGTPPGYDIHFLLYIAPLMLSIIPPHDPHTDLF